MTSYNFIKSGGRVLSTAPRYLLITLLLLITPQVFAVQNITGVGTYNIDDSSNVCPTTKAPGFVYGTPQEACNLCVTETNATGNNYICGAIINSTDSAVQFACDGTNSVGNPCTINLTSFLSCPPINGFTGTTIDGPSNICQYPDEICPTGQTYNANTSTCELPQSCTAGATQNFFGPSQSLALGTTIDICGSDLCIYSSTEDFEFLTGISAGNSQYSGTATGATCNTADNFTSEGPGTPEVPEPDTQPQNGCIESSNGEVWCTSDQTNSPPLPDNGTPGTPAQPDGQQNNQTTNTTNNFFNESTTNTSTNFGTTPGSTGGTTGSDGESDPSFGDIDTDGDGTGDCDPSTQDCGTSSVSGGATCASFPQCDGDPIQCAIRKQAWFTRCNLESNVEDITESDVMTQLGQTQTIEEYFDPANNPDNEVDVMSEVTLPTPDAGACPADLTMSLSTGPFTFPSQPICDVASLVRPAILALAYLISALMFYNGLVRDF